MAIESAVDVHFPAYNYYFLKHAPAPRAEGLQRAQLRALPE
jgi:hypothetical protein